MSTGITASHVVVYLVTFPRQLIKTTGVKGVWSVNFIIIGGNAKNVSPVLPSSGPRQHDFLYFSCVFDRQSQILFKLKSNSLQS